MATDPNLPNVLDAARLRVQSLAAELDEAAAKARNLSSTRPWSGPVATKFAKDQQSIAQRLRAQAEQCRAVAATIAADRATVIKTINAERLAARAAARRAEEGNRTAPKR